MKCSICKEDMHPSPYYIDTCSRCEANESQLVRIAELEAELAEAKNDLSLLASRMVYRGNSVAYIYDKVKCYGDQVMMAFNCLRRLGWDGSDCMNNDDRRKSLEAFDPIAHKDRVIEFAYSLIHEEPPDLPLLREVLSQAKAKEAE